MSTSPIPQTIDILSREKGIDPQVIISAIEDAVVTAARKQFKTGEDLRARYNPETGDVELFALMTVVDQVEDAATEISLAEVEEMGVEGAEVGDQLEFPKPREELGRIAAQTAKQIIFQKVREAERNNVYEEYINRVGELVHGFVKRFEGGRTITDLGKIEAVLPKTQQSRAESFSQGERVRVVINAVSKDAKGPQVEVSRTSPELLKRLFEMEVPEIYDGTVQIKAAVREPGDRAKIAVISTERDVDPVGACVGMKGSRVQAIIRELRGERIDIIEWSEDPAVFAANALSPAKVSKVEINSFEEKRLTVTVPEDQLSLAIGKKGQNVRLAARLVGWHMDIRSAEEAARAAAAQLEAVMAGGEATLTDIRESLALDQITAERLKDRGIETIEQLGVLTVDELVDAIDVSFDQANEIIERSHRLLAQRHARETRQAREDEESAQAAAAQAEAGQAEAGQAEAGAGVSVGEEDAETSSVSPSETVEEAEAEQGTLNEASGIESHPDEPAAPPDEGTLEDTTGAMAQRTVEETEEAITHQDATPEGAAVAEIVSEGGDVAPPESAYEPDPPRTVASAVPDFESMSSTEAQIQELAASDVSGDDSESEMATDEARGPMPAAGLEMQAPGEKLIPESYAEWIEEAGIEQSDDKTDEAAVSASVSGDEDDRESSPDANGPDASGSEVTPSEAAEDETGQEQTDELSPEVFGGEATSDAQDVTEGSNEEKRAAENDEQEES